MSFKHLLTALLYPSFRPNLSQLKQQLTDKTIVITGASYGIGEALTCLLADIPCQLILIARTVEKLQAIQQSLQSKPAHLRYFVVDFKDEMQLNACINFLTPLKIDILVNNAGKSICRSLMDSLDRFHDYQRTMQLNYYAPVKLCLALIPSLQQTKGQIINVSAINVLLAATPYWSAYQASKTAFDQWLRCNLSELYLQQIAVSSAYLPLVKTRMIAPTKAYQHAPALEPSQAAHILCKLMLNRKQAYKPWWTIIAQLGSIMFNGLWVKLTTWYLKKHHD